MTAEWEYEQPSRLRKWGLRLLALLMLAAVLIALYVIYEAAIADDDPAKTAVDPQLRAIVAPAGDLGDALGKLDPKSRNGGRAKARRAATQTITAMRTARRAFDDSDVPGTKPGEAIDNGLDAGREYFNAVAGTLKDPSSRLRADLPDRAARARRALNAMPNDFGLADEVRGVTTLRAWARAND